MNGLSFIFAGQDGIYNRLINQQLAFERIVKHFNLKILDVENSEYVLLSCLGRSEIPVAISTSDIQLILGLSSGFPYSIHLLGHEMFTCMLDKYDKVPQRLYVEKNDIVNGIDNIFRNKQNRFDDILNRLTVAEKKLIFEFASQEQKRIPFIFSSSSLTSIDKDALQSLVEKKIIFEVYTNKFELAYQFVDELFRTYISYNLIEAQNKLRRLYDDFDIIGKNIFLESSLAQ